MAASRAPQTEVWVFALKDFPEGQSNTHLSTLLHRRLDHRSTTYLFFSRWNIKGNERPIQIQQLAPIAEVEPDLEQFSYPFLDHCCHWGLSVLELPFAPSGPDGSLVSLFSSLPGPVNTDDSVATPVVTVHQIDNQLLATGFYIEAASASLVLVEKKCREVLDTSIRKIQVVEELKTQNNVPGPCHHLRRRHMVVARTSQTKLVMGNVSSKANTWE